MVIRSLIHECLLHYPCRTLLAPSSKSQKNSKTQAPNFSKGRPRALLERQRSSPATAFEIWNLGFGASSAFALLRRDKLGFGASTSDAIFYPAKEFLFPAELIPVLIMPRPIATPPAQGIRTNSNRNSFTDVASAVSAEQRNNHATAVECAVTAHSMLMGIVLAAHA